MFHFPFYSKLFFLRLLYIQFRSHMNKTLHNRFYYLLHLLSFSFVSYLWWLLNRRDFNAQKHIFLTTNLSAFLSFFHAAFYRRVDWNLSDIFPRNFSSPFFANFNLQKLLEACITVKVNRNLEEEKLIFRWSSRFRFFLLFLFVELAKFSYFSWVFIWCKLFSFVIDVGLDTVGVLLVVFSS